MIRMMVRRRHIADRLAGHGLADDAHHRLAEPAVGAILRRLDHEHVVVEGDKQHVLIRAVDLIDQIDVLRELVHLVARPRHFRRQRCNTPPEWRTSHPAPRGVDFDRRVVDARRHLTRPPHQASSRKRVPSTTGVSGEQRVERRVAEHRVRVERGARASADWSRDRTRACADRRRSRCPARR